MESTEALPRSGGNTFIADSDHGAVEEMRVSVHHGGEVHRAGSGSESVLYVRSLLQFQTRATEAIKKYHVAA